MSKIIVNKITTDKFKIQECVIILPSIQYFLNQINNIGISTKILLTSRNDDSRTKNLHNKLDLQISGKAFNKVTTFILRDWFRIKIKTAKGDECSAKSSQLLRKKYKLIQAEDIVILLDHIENSLFITDGYNQDFSVFVSKFEIENEYNKQQDLDEMNNVFLKIQKSLKVNSNFPI